MARHPRPLVLLAGAASLYLFLGLARVAVSVSPWAWEGLWTFVLVYTVLALGLIEVGRDLAPWRRSWLAGTLLLVSTVLLVFMRTNTEAVIRLLERGSGLEVPYPPITFVSWLSSTTWFGASALIAAWLWALRHRLAAVFWALLAGVVLLNRLDATLGLLPWRRPGSAAGSPLTSWFESALPAAEAFSYLLLGIVLIGRELRQVEPPAGRARAWGLLLCAIAASILVGRRAELPFPVVPIALAVASGAWIAYAAAVRKPGLARGAGRFVAGVVLFLLLGEAAQRGSERFARPWFLRMLTRYPDAMTILLFFALSFAVVLLAGGIWRVARRGPVPTQPSPERLPDPPGSDASYRSGARTAWPASR